MANKGKDTEVIDDDDEHAEQLDVAPFEIKVSAVLMALQSLAAALRACRTVLRWRCRRLHADRFLLVRRCALTRRRSTWSPSATSASAKM